MDFISQTYMVILKLRQFYFKYKGLLVFSVLIVLISLIVFELNSLTTDKFIGILESSVSSQLNIPEWKRTGLEIRNNGLWYDVEQDTLFQNLSQLHKILVYPICAILLIFIIRSDSLKVFLKEILKPLFLTTAPSAQNITSFIEEKQDNNQKEAFQQNTELSSYQVISETELLKELEDLDQQRKKLETKISLARKARLDKQSKSDHHRKLLKENDLLNFKGGKSGRLIIFVLSLSFLFLIITNSSPLKDRGLTSTDAQFLCRQYIAEVFGRDPSIMKSRYLSNDAGGHFVKVWYVRKDDNTSWENVCHISNNKIVWAGLFDGEIGRWRYEDERTI